VLREALREVSGTDWKIDAMVDPSAGTAGGGGVVPPPSGFGSGPAAPAQPSAPPSRPVPAEQGPGAVGVGNASSASTAGGALGSAAAGGGRQSAPLPPEPSIEEDIPDPDDEDVQDAGPTARDLLIRELGATVLEEGGASD